MIGTFCTKCRALVRLSDAEQCANVFVTQGTGDCVVDGCGGRVVPLYDENAFESLLPAGWYVGELRGSVYLRFQMGLGKYDELDVTQEKLDALLTSSLPPDMAVPPWFATPPVLVSIEGELSPAGYVIRSLVFPDGTRAVVGPDIANGAAVIYRLVPYEKGEA